MTQMLYIRRRERNKAKEEKCGTLMVSNECCLRFIDNRGQEQISGMCNLSIFFSSAEYQFIYKSTSGSVLSKQIKIKSKYFCLKKKLKSREMHELD